MIRILCAAAILTVTLAAPLHALRSTVHVDDYAVQSLQLEQGMPSNTANAMTQTPDGYIWIGTQRGVARYDGHRVTVFDHLTNPEMETRYIETLTSDASGRLVIATRLGVVLRLSGGKFERILTAEQTKGNVRSLLATRDGAIWCATEDGIVRRGSDGSVRRFGVAEGMPARIASAMALDGRDGMWIGTRRGLIHFDGKKFAPAPGAEALAGVAIFDLHVGRDGALYLVAYRKGTFVLRNRVLTQLDASDSTRWVVADRDGSIWIAGVAGLGRLTPGAKAPEPIRALDSNMVLSLFEAHDGSIWAGTMWGVYHLHETVFSTYSHEGVLAKDEGIVSLNVDEQGALYIGSAKGGVYRLRGRQTETLLSPTKQSDRAIWNISVGKKGTLWAGTASSGLFVLNGKTLRTLLPWQDAIAIPRPDGQTWVLGARNLGLIDANGKLRELHPPLLAGKRFYRIRPARDGGAWIATIGGGFFHLAADGVTARSVLQDVVAYAWIEEENEMWVGTLGSGLIRIRNGRTTRFHEKDGLADDDVMDLIDDGHGFFWVAGGVGIYRIGREELNAFADGKIKRLQPRVFGLADGLPTLEFNGGTYGAAKTPDGVLWFATPKGLVKVDPDPKRLRLEHQIETVVIENVDGDWQSPKRLRAGARPVTFRFTAPAFSNPDNVRFRYRLEGLDEDWIDAGSNRTATYSNIPYGPHRFVVAASLGGGPWRVTARPAAFELEKARAFHETYWFRTLMLFALCGLIAAAVSLRLRSMRLRQAQLEQVVKERTMLLAQANASLKRMSMVDPLTGIANRRRMDDHLGDEWRRAQRSREPMSLLFIDVDFFKLYNDAYGHQEGDRCLAAVAGAIGSSVSRPADLAARYGGEEFAVVLPSTELAGAMKLAESIRANVAALGLRHAASTVAPHVTLSIGVATLIPSESVSSDVLVAMADGAVYDAKGAGRNRVAVARPLAVRAAA